MKSHMEFVAVREVGPDVGRPLIRLGQEDAPLVAIVDAMAQLPEVGVGFGEVLAVCPLSLEEVGDGVAAESIESQIQPVTHNVEHGLPDLRVVVIEIRLMAEEAMPIIGLGLRVPGPVRLFSVDKDDSGLSVALVG